eukprot:TRINITY_DN2682_c0_g4_i2.p1 TRINITY_DN2682_c0_g4~~TRINITY_DN2682_c0_g4_i2.p1  ORF type:complete len:485 (-),score=101.16 TRINITY_DN2682_c0_g4_i2:69-1334(-)
MEADDGEDEDEDEDEGEDEGEDEDEGEGEGGDESEGEEDDNDSGGNERTLEARVLGHPPLGLGVKEQMLELGDELRFLVSVAVQGQASMPDVADALGKLPENVRRAREWPAASVASGPDAVPELATALRRVLAVVEGAATTTEPTFYYAHPEQGRLRMALRDPMPFSCGGIRCDCCQTEWILCGFRAVEEGNEVDKSSFHRGRTGWDICLRCAAEYLESVRASLVAAVAAAAPPASCLRQIRSPSVREDEYTLTPQWVAFDKGDVVVRWQVTQCGEYLRSIVVSEDEFADSTKWSWDDVELHLLTGGTSKDDVCSICFDLLSETKDGKIRPVYTACGHWFHEFCMKKYLRSNGRSCPLCRCENVFPSRLLGTTTLETRSRLRATCARAGRCVVVGIVFADAAFPVVSHAVVSCLGLTLPAM